MASTTIVPFASLPSCAVSCGALYDANGGCVPPAVTTGSLQNYAACFCSNAVVSALSTGTAGVCDTACTGTATSDLQSIHDWFTSFCAAEAVATTTAVSSGASTVTGSGTGTATSSTSTSKSTHKSNSDDYSWLSHHWQWVVFIVVVVVGIIGIWVGACLWHRRYTRRKDRQYALNNIRASTGAASATMGLGNTSQHNIHHHDSMRDSVIVANTGGAAGIPGPGAASNVAPGAAAAYDANTEKRRSHVLIGRRRK